MTGNVYQIARESIILPRNGWTKDGDLWACTVASAAVSVNTDVDIVLNKESLGVPLCGVVEPKAGQMTVYAYTQPTEDISATVRVTEVRP